MFDTVKLKLNIEEAGGVNLIEEIPPRLDNVTLRATVEGNIKSVSGQIVNPDTGKGLGVWVDSAGLCITRGSICKWYLGDNFQTMRRKDTQEAVELMSDLLNVQMSRAVVNRVDIGATMILKHPPEAYYRYLGELSRTKRLPVGKGEGLYYSQKERILCFYDKSKEHKKSGGIIPDIYTGQNVLRYEIRYLGGLAKRFNVPKLQAMMLYDESFYIRLVNEWRDNFRAIQKLQKIEMNEGIKSIQDLRRAGILELIKALGGLNAAFEELDRRQLVGEITRLEKHRLKEEIKKAVSVGKGVSVSGGELAKELEQTIIKASRYYR